MTVRRDDRIGRHDAAGFTLLEVMLAITIFGIVATTIYGTFSRTLRSKTLAETEIEVARTGRGALARMTDELGAAYCPDPPQGPCFWSVAGGTDSQPLDMLAFSALSNRGTVDGRDTDQRMITYLFSEDKNGMRRRRGDGRGDGARASGGADSGGARTSGIVGDSATGTGLGRGDARDRANTEPFDFFAAFGATSLRERGIPAERLLRRELALIQRPTTDDNGILTAFLDNVASLQFRFYDGTDWLEAWDSEDHANYPQSLPRAVEIDLGLYDQNGAVHHFATAVDVALSDPRRRPISSSPRPSGSPAPRSTP